MATIPRPQHITTDGTCLVAVYDALPNEAALRAISATLLTIEGVGLVEQQDNQIVVWPHEQWVDWLTAAGVSAVLQPQRHTVNVIIDTEPCKSRRCSHTQHAPRIRLVPVIRFHRRHTTPWRRLMRNITVTRGLVSRMTVRDVGSDPIATAWSLLMACDLYAPGFNAMVTGQFAAPPLPPGHFSA